MDAPKTSRIVLIHDWLTGMRGGEKVLEVFARLWPTAPLFTLLHRKGSTSETIEDRTIRTSFLNRLPGVIRYYRYLFPIMPFAVNWRLPECDTVLSSSHCVAKGVTAPAGATHICYCHTPMRYAWHMKDAYFGASATTSRQVRGLKGHALEFLLQRMRNWDRRTADGVHHFIANSRTTQARIRDCYGRDSTIIHPPVDTDFYHPNESARENFYLIVSACAPYKRLDLAIEACRRLKRRLIIIGTGQDEARLRSLAGNDAQFLGWQSDEVIRDHFRRCQALLFPGVEDFGIVPLEAQACGAPVIALGAGGATETIVPLGSSAQPTGVWFAEQTLDSLIDAMEQFEIHRNDFHADAARSHAERFGVRRFEREILAFVESTRSPTRLSHPQAA